MQKIIKWTPFSKKYTHRVYCEGIHDDYEGFRILLSDQDKHSPMLRLFFENPFLYQNRDESYMISHTNIEGSFEFPHAFYIIENSDLVERFHNKSASVYRDRDLKHYAIYTSNDCIDVLSDLEPKAEVLND